MFQKLFIAINFAHSNFKNMQKIFLLGCLVFPLAVLAQDNATINGNLKNIKDPVSTVYYMYRNADGNNTDSVKVVNGKYTFKINTELPSIVTLLSKDPNDESRPSKKDIATIAS